MAEAGAYDLVLMDIQMPIMDGYEALKRLRQSGFDKPVVALTAHAMRDEILRSQEAGFAGHLSKPLVMDALLKAIGELVSSPI